jgi:hypothetical protein
MVVLRESPTASVCGPMVSCSGGMTRSLDGQRILLVYGEIDLFVVHLQEALDGAGADSVIARTPADALIQLKRFNFESVLINYMPGVDAQHLDLLRALRGVPAFLICSASPPVAFLAALPILVKPVAADAVVVALARLRRP